MACITLFAQPLAMATTELARSVHYGHAPTGEWQPRVLRNPLRMNWVVATGSDGKPQLRIRWASDR